MPGPRVWGKYLWRSPHSKGCPGAISQPAGRIQASSVVSKAPLWAGPLVRGSFQPISEASRGSEAINAPGDNPAKVQNHCQEPYYQAAAAGCGSYADPITDQPSVRFSPQL
ncbi:C1RL isoform 5 [Pan troglodytes]|uniref:Complement C1r subcomponent like n=3 Tax=Pan TaxID=9596 RepID=A0A2I3SQK7_PANTR|nr:C1RL isoform 5 [Pan troglodytes]